MCSLECEVPSSSLRAHIKAKCGVARTYDLVLDRQKLRIPVASCLAGLAESVSFKFNESLCLIKLSWRRARRKGWLGI